MSLQWMRDVGVNLPDSPDLGSIMIVVLLIAGAIAIGWLIAFRIGSAVADQLHRFGASTSILTSSFVTAVIRYAIIALLLLIVGNAMRVNLPALMILAIALGISVAMLLFHLFVAFRLSRVIATGLALLALVATTAATLGGLAPLIDSLDAVGFAVGARRFSLLAVLNAIAIVAILYVVAKAANHVLTHFIGRSSALDVTQRVLVQKLAGISVIVVAILLGMDVLSIDLTALTVFSGAAGLAVGFGLQKTFGNLIAGLILLMDRSVKPGDVIVVGDTFGAVSKIGVRAVSVGHQRWQGTSHTQCAAHDRASRELVLFQQKCPHPCAGRRQL